MVVVQEVKSRPIFSLFLNKAVVVEAEGIMVIGTLVCYQLGSKNPHKPTILILKNMEGNFIILRAWNKIRSLNKL